MKEIKLFPHQVQAIKDTEDQNRVAYYLDMGLGKTFVASEKAKILGTDIVIIVCQKSKLEDWADHYTEFYPTCKVIIYKKPIQIIEPNSVIIINYDLIWRRIEFKKIRKYTLILDESSYIKNESSNRTKFILKMMPENIILLSGTPVGGKYEELYSQIKLLGWKITKKTFWDTYIKYIYIDVGGFKKKKVIGYKFTERMKRKLRENGAIFMKTEDVLTLPDKVEYEIMIPNIPQYKQFEKDSLVTINGIELVGDLVLTKRMYLRQLASMYNKHKYDKITEMLESTEDRLIIFYNFTEESKEIMKICKKLDKPVSIVNGEKRDLKNYESLDNSVTLIQYQAGSMGLNLQKANKIVYFSVPVSSDLFEQSKKRTHRLGQTRTCMYYYLITEKSIETKIFKNLKELRDYTDDLFKEC